MATPESILTPPETKSQPPSSWLTVREVADLLQVHPQSVYRLLGRRRIPYAKAVGVGIRINRHNLERYLDSSVIPPVRTRAAKF